MHPLGSPSHSRLNFPTSTSIVNNKQPFYITSNSSSKIDLNCIRRCLMSNVHLSFDIQCLFWRDLKIIIKQKGFVDTLDN